MSNRLPLAFLGENEEAVIVEVDGGRGLTRRLMELGFVRGAKVKVLRSHSPGPILVEVSGSRVALGKGVASKILVELGGV